MTSPVITLRSQENIGRIAKILDNPDAHNGYPVVDDFDPENVRPAQLTHL